MESLKYPILLAIIAGILTYLYLRYVQKPKQEIDDTNTNTNANTNKKNKNKVNIITPLLVGLIVGIISYLYLNRQTVFGNEPQSNPNPNPQYKLVKESESASPYHLMTRGVNVPNKLPDVFIETF